MAKHMVKSHILLIIFFLTISQKTLFSQQITKDSSSIYYQTKLNLSQEEIAWLKEHPVIKVGPDPNWAPLEYLDHNGEYKGIIIDYLKNIEKILNIKFEFSDAETWNEMLELTKNKKIDFLSGIVPTNQRSSYLLFTNTYISFPVSIFADEKVSYLRNINDLNGKKVALVKGYLEYEIIRDSFPDIDMVLVNSTKEGLKKLDSGEVFAFVGGMITTSYYIYEYNYKSIRIVGETPYNYSLSMGVRNNCPILVSILQKAFDTIPESEKNNIYNNWIILKKRQVDYKTLWIILTPILVALVLIIYWNRKLTKEVLKRRQIQAELEEAIKTIKETQTKLVQTEKMASIGMLTAGIAHEIKNPLNFITIGINGIKDVFDKLTEIIEKYHNYLSKENPLNSIDIENLKKELDFDTYKSEGEMLIDGIQKGAERIVDITRSLNTFSRTSYHEKILADVNEGIETALILLNNEYKYKIEVKKSLSNLPLIKCFPGKITQVFVNIIANAIQAIPNKGTISIKSIMEGNFVKISIKDSGIGIDSEKTQTIFEPFYTTKPEGEGTGLGLAITKNIIDEHNGKIEVFSKKWQGSEFVISLPIDS